MTGWGQNPWGSAAWGDAAVGSGSLSVGTQPLRSGELPRIYWEVDGRAVDVEGWTYTKVRLGGDHQFSGSVLEKVARRWPSSFQPEAKVQGFQSNGRPAWEGKLSLAPSYADGKAALQADGYKIDAESRKDALLYQIRGDTSNWATGSGPPWNRTDSASIDVFVDPAVLRYIVPSGTTVANGDAAPNTTWVPGSLIQRYAFTIDKSRSDSDFVVRVQRAAGPDGTATLITDHGLGGAQPTAIDSGLITPAQDCLIIRLARSNVAGGNPEAYLRLRLYDVRINDACLTDTFFTSDVVTDLGRRLGWDTSGVQASSVNALPLYITYGSPWSDAGFSYMAMQDDWHWRVTADRGQGPYLEYGSDSKVWTLYRAGTARPQLSPLTLYNGVIVFYRLPSDPANAPPKSVTVMASPDPLATQGMLLQAPASLTGLWQETLQDPQPDATLATQVAENLLPQYTTPRFAGRIDIAARSISPQSGNPYDVQPGDIADIVDWGPAQDLPQRIEEAEYRPDGVTLGINSPVTVTGLLARWANTQARSA